MQHATQHVCSAVRSSAQSSSGLPTVRSVVRLCGLFLVFLVASPQLSCVCRPCLHIGNPMAKIEYFPPTVKNWHFPSGSRLLVMVMVPPIEYGLGYQSTLRQPGFEPVTCWSQVQHPKFSATKGSSRKLGALGPRSMGLETETLLPRGFHGCCMTNGVDVDRGAQCYLFSVSISAFCLFLYHADRMLTTNLIVIVIIKFLLRHMIGNFCQRVSFQHTVIVNKL